MKSLPVQTAYINSRFCYMQIQIFRVILSLLELQLYAGPALKKLPVRPELIIEEEESGFGGSKPMVPYSSMFIFSPTNP